MLNSKRWISKVLATIRWRWGVLLLGLVFVWSVMNDVQLGEWYAQTLYPPLAKILSWLSSLLPFSIGDCFIYGSIIGLIIYLLIAFIRRKERWKAVRRTVEYLAWVYVWFYMAWGLNYFRTDFYHRTDTKRVKYAEERFNSFLEAYTDSLNASWRTPTDTIDINAIKQATLAGYQKLSPQFGLVKPTHPLTPKPMLCPRLMAAVGVTGYMGPFFNEFHVNKLLRPTQYPATYAHEMAHMLSVSNEAEANLYSFLVCLSSSDPSIRFSGYFALFPHVMRNARRLLDKSAYRDWLKTVRPEVKDLYTEEAAYWHSLYSRQIGNAQDFIYNLFLRSNKISSGTANYSEVIGLLIALNYFS